MQACFLGNVRVIGCNFLGDSHFQTYVMNNIEIVIDYYLHITSHVSHAFTSCTHFTSYSLLNFVHGIVCESSLAIQDYVFYGVWCKLCLRVGKKAKKKLCFWWLKTLFWSSELKTHVFEKHLNSFSCISFMKLFGLNVFCINFYCFSKKKSCFPEFQSIECVNCRKYFS